MIISVLVFACLSLPCYSRHGRFIGFGQSVSGPATTSCDRKNTGTTKVTRSFPPLSKQPIYPCCQVQRPLKEDHEVKPPPCRSHSVCGGLDHDILEFTCCEGKPHKGAGLSCCGNKAFNTTQASCCKGKVNMNLSQGVSDCCGDTAYDPLNQLCCDSRILTKNKPHSKCCGKVLYDDHQLCCRNGEQFVHPKLSIHHVCCGNQTYNKENKCCCSNLTINDKSPNDVCCRQQMTSRVFLGWSPLVKTYQQQSRKPVHPAQVLMLVQRLITQMDKCVVLVNCPIECLEKICAVVKPHMVKQMRGFCAVTTPCTMG
ncbi:hypothetical protein UPYG_G00196490 [Umbra pygmaea]|uniref:Galaxin-like repeats domain-containing protein n=1 Tax=Umbra pygmaea TaxID=75934 RepID=A0ABD0X3E6_UMBPY